MLVGLLVCLCVCASTRVDVLLSYSQGVFERLFHPSSCRKVVLRGPLIKGRILRANKGPAQAADVSRLC